MMFKELKNKKVTVKKGKRKAKKRQETKRKHLKVLLKYLDKDYASTKKTLYPMLESGIITFDLLWALYKPNTLAYTTTYGSVDEPRAFKIELAEKEFSFLKGEWYNIEGRYLEYDGKTWGMGTMDCDVAAFKGARKITSLNCYPLKYHKNEAKLRADLIARGKKFVSLQGVNYKCHEGMAYYKKRKQIIKVNINGRIMVDPAIHRRILPNYNVSTVKPKDPDLLDDSDDDSEEGCGCGDESSDEEQHHFESKDKDDDEPKMRIKLIKDDKDKPRFVEVPVDENGQELVVEKLEEVPSKKAKDDGENTAEEDKKELPVFTDEEYLIASPVVLGFAFAEKLWLEFTVSGVKEIVWNEGAYESLVLEDNTKEIVKALVESHKYHPAESIDDVIQGKGKGLVAVLHGPPGTGKTLTAEGISELLKCPLYMVSAGELGTDSRTLEGELQKILDIAHAWGAVLLLDEADVFLEKRTIQDIHRNALVSIFLRLLEYFQGILFLTTNRVETFDDAFQSRIHIALRYGELSMKAKKSVFKMFIERVRVLEGVDTMPFTEEDYTNLAKNNLNGRQVYTLQSTSSDELANISNRSRTQFALPKLSPSTRRSLSAWSTSSVFLTSPTPSIAISKVVLASRTPCEATSKRPPPLKNPISPPKIEIVFPTNNLPFHSQIGSFFSSGASLDNLAGINSSGLESSRVSELACIFFFLFLFISHSVFLEFMILGKWNGCIYDAWKL